MEYVQFIGHILCNNTIIKNIFALMSSGLHFSYNMLLLSIRERNKGG